MDKRRYFRFIYRSTFRYLAAALVISLLVGTLLGGGIYMVNAVCAFGFVMICWGWFTWLKRSGMRPFGRKPQKRKVPYLYRRFKEQRPHRPSFEMSSEDFDDDLTSATAVSKESFTEKEQELAAAIARAVCGILMVLFSLVMPI